MVANNLSGTAVYYESLLERLTDRSGFTNPATSQQVDEADSSLGLRLPEALRHFVQRYGALSTRSEFNLFGLGCSRAKSPSVIWAKKYLSFTSNLPANLLPVGTVNWDVYACLELEGAGRVLEAHVARRAHWRWRGDRRRGRGHGAARLRLQRA